MLIHGLMVSETIFSRNINSVDIAEKYRVIEFCFGYGGIHLGLSRAISNIQLVAVSEIEAFAVANLVSKMEAGLLDSAPVWPDLKTFPSSRFHGLVDLLVAGFPCQPFSQAGKRAGTEDPRHLFPHIIRAAVNMGLPDLFLENVEGIISAKTLDERPKLKEYCDQATERLGATWGKQIYSFLLKHAGISVLLHVLRELERLGYRAEAGVFSAAEVGAPHQRKRVFILAHCINASSSRLREVSRESGSETETGVWSGLTLSGREDVADSSSERLHQCVNEPGAQQEEMGSLQRQDAPGDCHPWPSRPGEQQHCWEPPRVVADSSCDRLDRSEKRNQQQTTGKQASLRSDNVRHGTTCEGRESYRERQTQPQMGRDSDGLTDRLDYAELYSTCDNRTDELRLLGNGVVPDTAERAWRVLSARLAESQTQ